MSETRTGLARPLAAEFIGTFALIFIGAGAATALGANHDPAVATGLYGEVPLYVTAQLVGGIIAGALYRWFWVQRRTPAKSLCSTPRQRNRDQPVTGTKLADASRSAFAALRSAVSNPSVNRS